MTKANMLAVAILALVLVFPRYSAWARQQSFFFGKQEIGLSIGYSPATPIGGAIRNVQYGYVAPRWGIGISDPIGGNSWYRGNFEFLAEGALLGEVKPRRGIAGGVTALLRYNFLSGTNFVPFINGGADSLHLILILSTRRMGSTSAGTWGLGYTIFSRNGQR